MGVFSMAQHTVLPTLFIYADGTIQIDLTRYQKANLDYFIYYL